MKRISLNIMIIMFCTQIIFGQKLEDSIIGEIRKSFIQTFKSDFIIVSDTIMPDANDINHWLVTVVPKRVGIYTVRYIFQYEKGWGYENNSYEFEISVNENGERRFIYHSVFRNGKQTCYDICLGDTISIPIIFNKNIISHSFSKESRYGLGHIFDNEAYDLYNQRLLKNDYLQWDVKNNNLELEFIGIRKKEIGNRHPSYSSVTYTAFFKAKKVGKFNLIIDQYRAVPINILPKNELIKTLAGHAIVREWEENTGSSGGTAYWLESPTLRVNDILIVDFLSYRDNLKKKRKISPKLKINKSYFALSNKGYDYWLRQEDGIATNKN